jgi:nitroimidazol reductase NimA-like FMN-containing flavoprotein (pyridoxamine 5'-phosphate oxidase superfamily)
MTGQKKEKGAMSDIKPTDFEPTERTRVRLNQELGEYDRETICQIIDQTPVCHVSTMVDGCSYIQATVHWRIDDHVYIHGAVKNKLVKAITDGAVACLAFTHFDGYVMPRSAFNHTVLYRSAIAFSRGRFVENLEEKKGLLEKFVEHVEPGRWDTVRHPSTSELKQTGIIEFELNEVSGKVMPKELAPLLLPGGPLEDPADAEVTPWTGIRPFVQVEQERVPASEMPAWPADD